MSKFKLVTSIKEVKELISYCKQTGYASVDFETSGLKYYEGDEILLCIGVSFQPGSAWVIPLDHSESPFKGAKTKKIMKMIGEELMDNWDMVKVAWNAKFEYKWFLRYGVKIKGRLFDAQLAKYTLDEERPNDLKSWVSKLFPRYANYEDEIQQLVRVHGGWANVPLEPLAKYCGADCDLTLRLMIYFEKRMIEQGFYNLFRNMLMMGTRVLAESEYHGMITDREYLEGLMKKYSISINDCLSALNGAKRVAQYNKKNIEVYKQQWIQTVEDEIESIEAEDNKNKDRLIANRLLKIKKYREGNFSKKEQEKLEGLNWGSPKQLIDFFFDSPNGLKLKPIEFTDSGAPSTAEATLLKLKESDKAGVIERLLEYRKLTKINSTYVEGMYKHLSSHNRIHASYKLAGTVTGRLSCGDPNFQNIPRDKTSSDIKKMFIPPPGYVYLEFDYSQAELRVVAEIAKDKAMIEIFQKGYNIHVATACKVNGGLELYPKVKDVILKDPDHPENDYWERQKKRAKLINFGILYGQTEKKLSIELGCSEREALEFINTWYDEYPQVAKWIKRQRRFAHEHEYVVNLFGRKRRLYDINDRNNFGKMLEAERQAVNSVIQGAASDFTVFSQVVVREEILKGNLPSTLIQANTVHDSIGYYIKPSDIHWVVPKVLEIGNDPQTKDYFGFQLEHVRMKLSVEVGRNWGDKHDYDPNFDYTTWVK